MESRVWPQAKMTPRKTTANSCTKTKTHKWGKKKIKKGSKWLDSNAEEKSMELARSVSVNHGQQSSPLVLPGCAGGEAGLTMDTAWTEMFRKCDL